MWEKVHNFACDSWLLLNVSHFFVILLSWLWNHVQSQQLKNNVRSGGLLGVAVVWGSVGVSSFGRFLGGFGGFLLVEWDFRWFQEVCCYNSYKNFTAYRRDNYLLLLMVARDWLRSLTEIFLFKVKLQKTKKVKLLLPRYLAIWK